MNKLLSLAVAFAIALSSFSVHARFTQADTYQGNGQDPVTLHKYLYANVNPVSYTDPSGRFGLSELSVTNNIVGILTQLQVDNGLNILGSQGVDVESAQFANKMLGIAALGAGGFQLIKYFSKKAAQKGLMTINKIDMDHINGVHLTATSKKVTGYHHRPSGVDAGSWTTIVKKGPDKNGVYEAEVYFQGKTKSANSGMSTFFPDAWSSQRVEAEIMSAYMNSKGGVSWKGRSASGVWVEGYANNGVITSAFPSKLP